MSQDIEVALVTGAAGDIGSAVVAALAARGARVVGADRAPADVALDVTVPEQWAAVVAEIERAHGRLDVLVNAAGVEGAAGPLWTQEPEEFEAVMRVNATGTFLGLRAALPLLCQGGGAVVNVASTAGILGLPGMSPYVASKHAVVGLTRAAAVEAARFGVRVNAVCPGPTAGRMMDAIEQGARPDDPARARAAYEAAIPLRRYGTAEEVAAMIAHLTSPAAAYVTGAVIPVDGGMSAL
jgi:NAD(P)-dependent dehydrogenase (short-subunit alcohol dehydrogenase family)